MKQPKFFVFYGFLLERNKAFRWKSPNVLHLLPDYCLALYTYEVPMFLYY